MSHELFEDNNLNLVILFNKKHKAVWAESFNPLKKSTYPAPKKYVQYFSDHALYMLKNKSKADLNKDGNISSYERKRGMAIEKAMSQQNRVKKKNGGFIARGCGKVMAGRNKKTKYI